MSSDKFPCFASVNSFLRPENRLAVGDARLAVDGADCDIPNKASESIAECKGFNCPLFLCSRCRLARLLFPFPSNIVGRFARLSPAPRFATLLCPRSPLKSLLPRLSKGNKILFNPSMLYVGRGFLRFCARINDCSEERVV